MTYEDIFIANNPSFFEKENIKNLPEDESFAELVIDLKKESIEALPYDFPAGITFAEYKGDIEKLIKAVAEVEDGWVKYFEEGGRVFCAFDGDEIAAFCFITDMGMHDGVHVGGPGCVGTVPKYRKRGIGLEMVRRATIVLAAEGYDISWIHYTHLAHWYEKLGYHTILEWNSSGFIKGR